MKQTATQIKDIIASPKGYVHVTLGVWAASDNIDSVHLVHMVNDEIIDPDKTFGSSGVLELFYNHTYRNKGHWAAKKTDKPEVFKRTYRPIEDGNVLIIFSISWCANSINFGKLLTIKYNWKRSDR